MSCLKNVGWHSVHENDIMLICYAYADIWAENTCISHKCALTKLYYKIWTSSEKGTWYTVFVLSFVYDANDSFRARIKDLEGQGHFQKGHFRLRRALWLSKKAPRPSKKRHKGQKNNKKGQQIQRRGGGGGGGGTPTHFFFDLKKKKIPPKSKKKKKSSQTAQLSLSSLRSTQCKTHCNANGMRCDLHRHEITSINDQKKPKN